MNHHVLGEALTLLEYERHNRRVAGLPEATVTGLVVQVRHDLTELLATLTSPADAYAVRAALLLQISRLLEAADVVGRDLRREAGTPDPGVLHAPDGRTVAAVEHGDLDTGGGA